MSPKKLWIAALRDGNMDYRAPMEYHVAVEWVESTEDDDDIDESTLVDVFRTLYEREPCKNDYELGLWSLCCAAVQSI